MRERNLPVAPSSWSAGSSSFSFYRSVWFQIIVIGMIAFSGPSMWDALGGLGGGGQATPYVANAAACVTYSMLFLFCLIGGPIVNLIGLKWSLVLGTIGFPLYGAGLYCNSAFANQWFLIFGSTLSGIGGALWYVAEATIILTYPEPAQRGRMIAVWIAFRNGGSIIGGSINLALNAGNSESGSVSLKTYLVFVALMCIGFPIAFLLSHPTKVRRADGSKVGYSKHKHSIGTEMKLLWSAITDKRNLLLAPYFFSSFLYIAVSGTFNGTYFSVRSRALSSLTSALGGIVGSFALGALLDNQRLSMNLRAKLGFAIVMVLCGASYIWLAIVQGIYLKNPPSGLDWSEANWARGGLIYLFINTFGQMGQNYIYWLLSAFLSDTQSNARHGGVFRSIEAAGQAISYGVESSQRSPFVGIGFMLALWVVSLPGTY